MSVHKEEDGELVPIDDDIPHYDDHAFVVAPRARQAQTVRGIVDPSCAYDEPRESIDGRHEAPVEDERQVDAEEDDFGVHDMGVELDAIDLVMICLLYTSPSPRDA